jgi:hypothetical protein
MARLLDDASTEYLEIVGGSPPSTEPLTLAGWFRTNDDAIIQSIITLDDANADANSYQLTARGNAGDVVSGTAGGGTFQTADTTTSFTVNTWHHAAAVFRTSGDFISAYIDGGSKGSNTTDAVVGAGIDHVSIGVRRINNPNAYFSGDLAEIAVWNVDLTDAEIAILALGVPAYMVRPASLVHYAPLVRNLQDIASGVTATATGTAVSDHPRIFRPSLQQVRKFSVASVGGSALMGGKMTGATLQNILMAHPWWSLSGYGFYRFLRRRQRFMGK